MPMNFDTLNCCYGEVSDKEISNNSLQPAFVTMQSIKDKLLWFKVDWSGTTNHKEVLSIFKQSKSSYKNKMTFISFLNICGNIVLIEKSRWGYKKWNKFYISYNQIKWWFYSLLRVLKKWILKSFKSYIIRPMTYLVGSM